jgi:hypothetical protein
MASVVTELGHLASMVSRDSTDGTYDYYTVALTLTGTVLTGTKLILIGGFGNPATRVSMPYSGFFSAYGSISCPGVSGAWTTGPTRDGGVNGAAVSWYKDTTSDFTGGTLTIVFRVGSGTYTDLPVNLYLYAATNAGALVTSGFNDGTLGPSGGEIFPIYTSRPPGAAGTEGVVLGAIFWERKISISETANVVTTDYTTLNNGLNTSGGQALGGILGADSWRDLSATIGWNDRGGTLGINGFEIRITSTQSALNYLGLILVFGDATPVTPKRPCLVRDYTGELMLFHISATGTMVVRLYGSSDGFLSTITIDSTTTCNTPTFWLAESILLGAYVRGTTPYLARSMNHGRSWTLTAITGTYDAVTIVPHRERLVLLGYKISASQWYQRVGTLNSSNVVTWSAEVACTFTSPAGEGHLLQPVDNALFFAWKNTSNSWFIAQCRSMSDSAVGSWL